MLFRRFVEKSHRYLLFQSPKLEVLSSPSQTLWACRRCFCAASASRSLKTWLTRLRLKLWSARTCRAGASSLQKRCTTTTRLKSAAFLGCTCTYSSHEKGVIASFAVTAANRSEEEVEEVLSKHAGQGFLAGNGYNGERLSEAASTHAYQVLVSSRLRQKPILGDRAWPRCWLRTKPDLIETAFSMLADQLTLRNHADALALGCHHAR